MTNEIKEILNWLFGEYPEEELIIEDYITNLQEENKKLKKQYAKEEKKLFHDNEILQQRIDKAVEYIKWNLDKNEELIEYFNYDANFNELLNILRGDE